MDAQGFFSFDVKECGINERCSFDEIKKILDTTSDVEEQKEMLRRNHDQLIGRTVTVDRHSGFHQLPERPGPRHRHHR